LTVRSCSGVVSGVLENIASLGELDELKINACNEEGDRLMAVMTQVVAHGPQKMSYDLFGYSGTHAHQVISDVVSGLRLRQGRTLTSFRFVCPEMKWPLQRVREELLPLLRGVEELRLDASVGTEEVRHFFEGLGALENLKALALSGIDSSVNIDNAILKYVRKCETIEECDVPTHRVRDRVEYYLQLNRCGRQHLRDPDRFASVCPQVLSKVSQAGEKDGLFEFLRILSQNEGIQLFKDAGRPTRSRCRRRKRFREFLWVCFRSRQGEAFSLLRLMAHRRWRTVTNRSP